MTFFFSGNEWEICIYRALFATLFPRYDRHEIWRSRFSGGGDAKKDSITKEVLGVGDGWMDGGRGG